MTGPPGAASLAHHSNASTIMTSSSSSGGISFGGLLRIWFIGLELTGYISWPFLQILFIGLKLTGDISWPWWLVLLPTIIPLGIVAILFLFLGVCLLLKIEV